MPQVSPRPDFDLLILGAGAAGLATAAFLGARNSSKNVAILESAAKPGAKILISGGGRCNLTNTEVTEGDFWGGHPPAIRRILKALPVPATLQFFSNLGVHVHEESDGKLFPDSNRARDVLDALLREVARVGCEVLAGHRVTAVRREGKAFCVSTDKRELDAKRVVLATGGRSVPKTGSDGAGYAFAQELGHTLVRTTPALAPLLLDRISLQSGLAGVAHPAELALWIDGRVSIRLTGPVLWTHFGISGPVALNMSRHWARAAMTSRELRLSINFAPGVSFDAMDERVRRLAQERPRATAAALLASWLPGGVASMLANRLELGTTPASQLTREARRRLAHALVEFPLAVTDTRGFNYAEATAGGVSLQEIDPATMESRVCPGLYLVGEILDVDGRLGGFNFQWAWSTAYVAARAISRDL